MFMTIKDIINYAYSKSSDFKDFEIEAVHFLIQEYLGINRSQMIMMYNDLISPSKLDLILKAIDKYIDDCYPVQYILAYTYFYSMKLIVSEDVLIPRFDTEFVVEKAIEEVKSFFGNKAIRICDIGTGSGAIAIALFKNLDNVSVDAIDISSKALDIAKKNASLNNANINFIENDLLDNINFKYDLIISNPPYISYDEKIMDLVGNNEPINALFSDDNGLYHYKRILDQSLLSLKEKGLIVFEIPDNKSDKIYEYASKYYSDIKVYKDYNGQRRALIIRK